MWFLWHLVSPGTLKQLAINNFINWPKCQSDKTGQWRKCFTLIIPLIYYNMLVCVSSISFLWLLDFQQKKVKWCHKWEVGRKWLIWSLECDVTALVCWQWYFVVLSSLVLCLAAHLPPVFGEQPKWPHGAKCMVQRWPTRSGRVTPCLHYVIFFWSHLLLVLV